MRWRCRGFCGISGRRMRKGEDSFGFFVGEPGMEEIASIALGV